MRGARRYALNWALRRSTRLRDPEVGAGLDKKRKEGEVAKRSEDSSRRHDGRVRQSGYEEFQKALLEGRLRPGQLVSQRDLVDMLGLSIGALREVLPRLESEALIHVLPQRGIQIPAIDLPMIRDAFQMRAALEREAVLHALRTLPDDVLQTQLALHRDLVESVRETPSDAALARGQEIDTNFHMLLVKSTGNELIKSAYDINSIRIRLIKLDRIRLTAVTLPAAFADHIAVIDALLARDAVKAAAAMDRHIANARERALEL
ncbi:putative HTH-type transcriptional regulator YjjM [Tritonibacter horizontis]|uniref:Putative HTH-type transcriptional regulator YjjM n=1 Tax=Tritonibacter horizontis TaxID=1768241 RepID=A0A132BT81_9RHOB|nr:putative HTH-type transcriptional regulator YjjM [Tritonibacter horizontis]